MLLSRFWYLFLSLAAAAAVAAALLSQSVVNTRENEMLEEALVRDRIVLDALLRLEARARLDRIAFISVDGQLGGLLRQARDVIDEKKLRELNASVRPMLRGHVNRILEAAGSDEPGRRAELEPDLAFALDANGRVIGQLGPLEANPAGASLATFPLVRRALQGYVRDDVWLYDRKVYRMAARPVIAGSEYVGAIVHGYRFDKGLAQKLATNLGAATVVFFESTSMLTSHVPIDPHGGAVPQAQEVASAAAKAISDAKFKNGERTDSMMLDGGGKAIFVPITGEAGALQVGYAIARPRRVLIRPDQVFDRVSKDEVNALPLPILGGGALLATLFGLLFMYLERDRHMRSLTRKTAEIVSGDRDRLIVTEWRGAYRRLADQVNQAIDKWVERAAEAAPTRRKADLQEILGPTPEASATPFFAFADDAAPPPPPAPKPAAPTPAVAAPAVPSKASVLGVAPPSAPRAQVSTQVSVPVPAQPPTTSAARPPAPAAASPEEAHFREVYEQYVATRQQCGESVDSLTFEKFGVTLRKTRDQLIDKHGATAVRFTVQVKEGKAALKAQPVK